MRDIQLNASGIVVAFSVTIASISSLFLSVSLILTSGLTGFKASVAAVAYPTLYSHINFCLRLRYVSPGKALLPLTCHKR